MTVTAARCAGGTAARATASGLATAFGQAADSAPQAVLARDEAADGTLESLRTLLLAWLSDEPEPDQRARLWLDACCRSTRSPAVEESVDQVMQAGLLAAGLADRTFRRHDPDAVAWQLLTARAASRVSAITGAVRRSHEERPRSGSDVQVRTTVL